MKNWQKIALVVVAVLVLAALIYRKFSHRSDSLSPEQAILTPLPQVKADEIKFNDTIIVENTRISIDGAPLKEVPCGDTQDPIVFAEIDLGGGLVAELECLDNYMGGISLAMKEEGLRLDTQKLGLAFADAGDTSDMRSWIKHDASTNSVLIYMVSYWSQEDIEELEREAGVPEKVECGNKIELLKWDPKAKKFLVSEVKEDLSKFRFDPPPSIHEKCMQ